MIYRVLGGVWWGVRWSLKGWQIEVEGVAGGC